MILCKKESDETEKRKKESDSKSKMAAGLFGNSEKISIKHHCDIVPTSPSTIHYLEEISIPGCKRPKSPVSKRLKGQLEFLTKSTILKNKLFIHFSSVQQIFTKRNYRSLH